MSEGSDAQTFRQGIAAGNLYVGKVTLSWQITGHGMYADVPIEGASARVRAYIRVRFNERPDSYSVNVFWNTTRLYGFDNDGSPHPNAHGTPIRPPHRQWFREDGREDAEAVDVAKCGLTSCERAVLYVLGWCGLKSGHQWSDPPPLQRNTSNTGARVHKRGGRRR